MSIESIKQALENSSLFHGVPQEYLKEILPICQEEVAVQDAVVVKQGEPAHYIYLVEEGRVALNMELDRPDGSSTGNTTVASIGPGESFGWSALVEPYVGAHSATAVELSRVVAIKAEALLKTLGKRPEVGFLVMSNVASLIAERLVETREALAYHRSYTEYLKGPSI